MDFSYYILSFSLSKWILFGKEINVKFRSIAFVVNLLKLYNVILGDRGKSWGLFLVIFNTIKLQKCSTRYNDITIKKYWNIERN